MEKYRIHKLRSGSYIVYNEELKFSNSADNKEEAIELKNKLNDELEKNCAGGSQ